LSAAPNDAVERSLVRIEHRLPVLHADAVDIVRSSVDDERGTRCGQSVAEALEQRLVVRIVALAERAAVEPDDLVRFDDE
jgi:hypothetical protein